MRISTHAPAGGATHRKLLPVRPYYISTHAPAGGATFRSLASTCRWSLFLLTPLREGRLAIFMILQLMTVYFYSRPCGRGDAKQPPRQYSAFQFLLTPLREGRPSAMTLRLALLPFLLTPLREGRRDPLFFDSITKSDFYSRPCGRGDSNFPQVRHEVLRQIAER